MKLTTANKIKVYVAKDINKHLNFYFPCLNKQGKKLSNPFTWVVKINKVKLG